jgi:hypothetical protein
MLRMIAETYISWSIALQAVQAMAQALGIQP